MLNISINLKKSKSCIVFKNNIDGYDDRGEEDLDAFVDDEEEFAEEEEAVEEGRAKPKKRM